MDHVAVIERESARLRAAATDLAAPVPSCPGWDVAELVRHVGTAHRNAAVIVGQRLDRHPDIRTISPPDDADPIEWLTTSTAELLDVLRSTDPTTPVWTFGPDGTAAFWARRMAHETLVHRVDLGDAGGIEPEPAVDGIAEAFEVFLPLLAPRDTEPPSGTLHLHATDADGEWLLSFGTGRVDVVCGHAKGDAAVRGPAADLLLWCWGRLPIDALERFGDDALPARLRRVLSV